MNKLREKFENTLIGFNGHTGHTGGLLQCEQITDDFSVKFFDWANVNAYKFPTKTTTTELQQYFKENIYE